MVDTRELKAQMVRKGFTQKKLAESMGITERTLQNKFKRGIFNSDEMYLLTQILQIKKPCDIFFANQGT